METHGDRPRESLENTASSGACPHIALSWIAAGAKREGLCLKRGVRLAQKLDTSAVVLHDPHGESSNLWGAFDRVRRRLPQIRLHFACKGL